MTSPLAKVSALAATALALAVFVAACDEQSKSSGITPKQMADALHAIIYGELIKGVVTDASRKKVRELIAKSGEHEADSVIFGCTEIGMLFPPTDAGLPGYDTLELHARALIDFAMG